MALILALFRRLLAFGVAFVMATLLPIYREWKWVEKLRPFLLVESSWLFSLGIDAFRTHDWDVTAQS